MHLKIQKIPNNWPIKRKKIKYVARNNFKLKESMPLLVVLRDILNLAQNRREVKSAIYSKNILLNGKTLKDENASVILFDKISIIPSNKYYELNISEKGKFYLKEIKEPESNYKVAKIKNKKTLNGKKIQLNLSDGRNYLSDMKYKINDSVIIDFKKNQITKCLPLEERAKALVLAGKHIGTKGNITKINGGMKIVELDSDGKKINVLINQLIVIE